MFHNQLRERSFLTPSSIWLIKGKRVNKNLRSPQRFDTSRKSYQKLTNDEVIQDKKDFLAVLYKHIDSYVMLTCSVFRFSMQCRSNTLIHKIKIITYSNNSRNYWYKKVTDNFKKMTRLCAIHLFYVSIRLCKEKNL